MDARELTKEYEKLQSDYEETKKTVTYLEMEVNKLRLLVDDMKYDMMDLQKQRWCKCVTREYVLLVYITVG